MKNWITFFYLFLLAALTVQDSYAQNNDSISAEINVSATVTQSIELITVNSMTFGDLQPGQEQVYINPISNLNAGFMIAVGTPNAQFRLTYLTNIQLINSNGKGNLVFTYELAANFEEEQSTAELLGNDNRNLIFNNEGRYYIWVGGRVNLRNAQPGNYSGDFTIEIDYI
jgi:hypothetical protein